ncbi:hypothetical protein [Streptomyces sp. TR06-5]|uniref:SCO2584 family spore wall biosynthesis protein n=1 Tax=Streptomyces sp. TR06-5 TaxID=3385976 RepID=UPI00399FCE05
MPEDLGGRPSPDGEEPDEENHGRADDEFAAVVLDEEFVQSADVHEPTAAERMLAAAQPHPENDLPRPWDEGYVHGPPGQSDPGDGSGTTHGFGFGYDARPGGAHPQHEYSADDGDPQEYDPDEALYGPDGADRPYRGHVRWQRPVALLLAVVMGVGVVALAFAAVYRSASAQRDRPAPSPATGLDISGRDGAGGPGTPARAVPARPDE